MCNVYDLPNWQIIPPQNRLSIWPESGVVHCHIVRNKKLWSPSWRALVPSLPSKHHPTEYSVKLTVYSESVLSCHTCFLLQVIHYVMASIQNSGVLFKMIDKGLEYLLQTAVLVLHHMLNWLNWKLQLWQSSLEVQRGITRWSWLALKLISLQHNK